MVARAPTGGPGATVVTRFIGRTNRVDPDVAERHRAALEAVREREAALAQERKDREVERERERLKRQRARVEQRGPGWT